MGDADVTAKEESGSKLISLEEVEKHANVKDCWMVIHGKVYNVTEFLDEHPGGDEVMISSSGRDATDDFEDVGHSTSARKQLEKFYIGEFDASSVPPEKTKSVTKTKIHSSDASDSTSLFTRILQFLVPLAILALAVAVRFLTKPEVISQSE